MIQEKSLQELQPQRRYESGQNISLESIRLALQQAAAEHEIRIAFSLDQVKGGLLGPAEDCLVLYHPDHVKDYFSLAIRVKYQGTYTFINVDSFGTSKLMKQETFRHQMNASVKESLDYHGYNPLVAAKRGASLIGAGAAGIRHLVTGANDKANLEIEQQWYSIVLDMINSVI